MKIQAIKTFKWCINGNVYPNDFLENDFYDVDDVTANDIVSNGLAIVANGNIEAIEIAEVAESAIVDAGWEEPQEAPFTEEAGSELSASQQEIASQEKITPLQIKKGKKAGAQS